MNRRLEAGTCQVSEQQSHSGCQDQEGSWGDRTRRV